MAPFIDINIAAEMPAVGTPGFHSSFESRISTAEKARDPRTLRKEWGSSLRERQWGIVHEDYRA
jgi:hypothetical protein